jgi:integrase/recombinase XerD
MGLNKQAKTLSRPQIKLITGLIQQTRYPVRNRAIFLLSVKAGLRAKEIANLTWDMVTEADGSLSASIHLRNEASKGRSGRIIPINKELREVLEALQEENGSSL